MIEWILIQNFKKCKIKEEEKAQENFKKARWGNVKRVWEGKLHLVNWD